jgi:hypothetical protein
MIYYMDNLSENIFKVLITKKVHNFLILKLINQIFQTSKTSKQAGCQMQMDSDLTTWKVQVKLWHFERRPFVGKLVAWIGKIHVLLYCLVNIQSIMWRKINKSDEFIQDILGIFSCSWVPFHLQFSDVFVTTYAGTDHSSL